MMKKRILLSLAFLIVAGVTTADIGPRFGLGVQVLEPDGTQTVQDGGTYDTVVEACLEAERINRDGLCLRIEESPELAAVCYPSARLIRVRVVKIYF